MTKEKRREMQLLKEQAIRVEERIYDKKAQKSSTINKCKNGLQSYGKEGKDGTLSHQEDNENSYCKLIPNNVTVSEVPEERQSIIERSRKDLITKVENVAPNNIKVMQFAEIGDNKNPPKEQETVVKHNKSLIIPLESDFDEILDCCAEKYKRDKTQYNKLQSRLEIDQLERSAKLNYVQTTSPIYTNIGGKDLPLVGYKASCSDSERQYSVPSINVEPPTPQSDHMDYNLPMIGDGLTESDSNESLIISDLPPDSMRFIKPKQMCDTSCYNNFDMDTEEKSMICSEQDKDYEKYENLEKLCDVKDDLHHNNAIILDRIENNLSSNRDINGEAATNTVQTSPSLTQQTSQMNRSITSPCLDGMLTYRSQKNNRPKSSPTQKLPNTQSTQLVRSNSFVLECPSKVLIEHMRQQNAARYSSLNLSNTTNNHNDNNRINNNISNSNKISNYNANSSKSTLKRLTRDTVESKAKKVNKLSTLSRVNRSLGQQQGSTSSKVANSNTSSAHISISLSANHVSYANKRSPYDPVRSNSSAKEKCMPKSCSRLSTTAKTKIQTHQSSNSIHINDHNNSISNSNSNSNDNTNNISKLMKSSQAPVAEPALLIDSNQSYASSINQKQNSDSECDSHMLDELNEKHRQSLLNLLAKQDTERRKLYELFEKQQEHLVEQLSLEMMEYIQNQQAQKQKERQHYHRNCITPSHNTDVQHNSQSLPKINLNHGNRVENKSLAADRSSAGGGRTQTKKHPINVNFAITPRNAGRINNIVPSPIIQPVTSRAVNHDKANKINENTTPRRHLYVSDALIVEGGSVLSSQLTENTRIPAPTYPLTYSTGDSRVS